MDFVPGQFGISGKQAAVCKYGENAWQTPAALMSFVTGDPLALDKFEVLEGQPPSYNNWCDIDRMLQTMTHIAAAVDTNLSDLRSFAVGAKHGNACGASWSAYGPPSILREVINGDPLAIFGGLVMTNFAINEDNAEHIAGKMLDGVIAPACTQGAISRLRRKGDKCRFIVNPALGSLNSASLDSHTRFRYVRGGFLRQPNYTFVLDLENLDGPVVRHGTTTTEIRRDMLLGWAIGSTSTSNTIVLVKNDALIGSGVGQKDRVGAAKLVIELATRSGHDINGSVAYSDSFFPFPDGPQVLIDAGVKAILTSSGSVKDKETIDVCQKNNVALYMIPDAVGRGFYGH